jgi:hypothetical protein
MRTTILISLCSVALIAVIFDLLLIRPVSPTTLTSDVHVATVNAGELPKTVRVEGATVVGFSCVGLPNGVQCYIASR